jgi:inner membrane protein
LKGTTHSLIGLAAVSAVLPITGSISLTVGPEKLLPFIFAYAGALICDIDTGSSTVSNFINPIKLKYIRTLMYSIFVLLSIAGTMYFWGSKYLYTFLILIPLASLTLNNISCGILKLVKKVAVIVISVGLIIVGIVSGHYPMALIGTLLLALSFSPHRGYSHSIAAVAATFYILKYTFSFYSLADYSISFCIGMLSHILADMFTQKGVSLLFPVQRKLSFPLTFKTGSAIEGAISAASILCIIILNFKNLI